MALLGSSSLGPNIRQDWRVDGALSHQVLFGQNEPIGQNLTRFSKYLWTKLNSLIFGYELVSRMTCPDTFKNETKDF